MIGQILLFLIIQVLAKNVKNLRAAGKIVFGGTEYTDALELDRNFGQEELKNIKLKLLPSKEFFNFQDAIDLCRKTSRCLCYKTLW